MIKYKLTQKSINLFKEKYYDNIVKEQDNKLFMRCVFPDHEDSKRSAVLYIDDGVYHCSLCGSYHISKLLNSGVEFEPTLYVNKPGTYTPLIWDFKKYPDSYMYPSDKNLLWVNTDTNGGILGHGWRIQQDNKRIYGAKGKVGFRLNSPIITESTTDAVWLIEHGVDAGAICSVTNWKNIKPGQIFFPQNDDAGLKCAERVSGLGASVFKWFLTFPQYKDICEFSEGDGIMILETLK